jgi:hypothetical protein
MRFAFLFMIIVLFPIEATAVEAPPAQVHLDATKVLRGQFLQQFQMKGAEQPMQSTGHFVVTPAYGLIWNIEQPFPTATIITPNGATQNIGGLILKLPTKNLRHLYDMVGGALAGDWSNLEQDFIITPGGDAHHWQMVLTPRQTGKAALSYARITVTGGKFVENIVMTKADGTNDQLSFGGEVLGGMPLSGQEVAYFGHQQ